MRSSLSVRRATAKSVPALPTGLISIHALRKESDSPVADHSAEDLISIHALRKESDQTK